MDPRIPANPNQMAAYIRKLEQKIDQLAGQMSTLKIQGDLPASLPGQYAGKPIPTIEGVEIDIVDATRVNGNITIASDGPFIARGIHFAWRPTAGANANLWRPISSVEDLAVAGVDVLNFYWEYQVSGSKRNRQNDRVPSTVVSNGDRGNGYYDFMIEDVFSPTATVSIWITPTLAPTNEGVLFVGFDGAYVLE